MPKQNPWKLFNQVALPGHRSIPAKPVAVGSALEKLLTTGTVDVEGMLGLGPLFVVTHDRKPSQIELGLERGFDGPQDAVGLSQLASLGIEQEADEEFVGSLGDAGEIEDGGSVGGEVVGPALVFFFSASQSLRNAR